MGWLLDLLGSQLDHVIDTEDGDGGFGGESDGLDFGDHWLEDSCREVVLGFTLDQVESAVFEVGLCLIVLVALVLRSGVEDSELGDQLGGILGSVSG